MRKRYFLRALFFLIFLWPVLSAPEKPIITVLDLNSNNVSEKDTLSIVSFISAALYDSGRFEVIDTARRDMILSELSFSLSGCGDETCQLEVGRLLSAEYIVTGDFSRIGSRYMLTVKMMETETSKTVGTAQQTYTDLDMLVDDIRNFTAGLIATWDGEPFVPVVREVPEERRSISMRKILPWVFLGTGTAVLGTGGYLLYSGLDYLESQVNPAYDEYINSAEGASELWDAYMEKHGEYKDRMITAALITGAGAVLTGVSGVLFFTGRQEDPGDFAALLYGGRRSGLSLCSYPGSLTVSFGLTLGKDYE